MHSRKMNMITMHTIESKKEYILFVPKYYFEGEEFDEKNINNVIETAKKRLKEYASDSNIVSIIVTDEILPPMFPELQPRMKYQNSLKYRPIKVINVSF